ncbi:MAG: DUF2145 domain-containing protein [Burkholderiaceae bacterium]
MNAESNMKRTAWACLPDRPAGPRPTVTRWLRGIAASLMACVAMAAAPVQAGQSCEPYRPGLHELRKTFNLAERTARWLDQSGADVAIIARAGQDLRAYGLNFSHVAYVYRLNADHTEAGVWRVVHMLNRCGSAHSDLYRQGLAEFFNDQPFRWQAAIVVPRPEVQARLLPLMSNEHRLPALHDPDYSMVAYPWAQTYQQSNAWVLETFAMAMEPGVHDRRIAQAWLLMHDYRPGTLRIGAAKRFGAALSRANVSFDDHPSRELQRNRVETVTADSLLGWLHAGGFGAPAVLIE